DVMPDIVLLDIEMPNLSGSETFEMIRKSYPSLKVIFLSTHFEELLMEHFISKGASAFLSKNNDIEVVAETIRLVYENKYIQAYSFSEKKFENGRKLKFSKRESEIIPLICAGKSNKEIAESLEIGNKAVEAHKNNLFKKTKTKSAAELINYIFKRGLNHLN
ncbi:MAG: response regulator transcription factor, partial [Bacteroidia bacterium]